MSIPILDSLDLAIPVNGDILTANDGTSVVQVTWSNGAPNGLVTAPRGSICMDVSTGILWSKLIGAGSTGWDLPIVAQPDMGAFPSPTQVV